MEEAVIMGFSGGCEQGKPATALPELINFISINIERVNPYNYATNKITVLAFYHYPWVDPVLSAS